MKRMIIAIVGFVGVTFIGNSADAAWCTCACSNGQLINVCTYGEVKDPSCFGPCYKQEVPDEQATLKLLESLVNGPHTSPALAEILQQLGIMGPVAWCK